MNAWEAELFFTAVPYRLLAVDPAAPASLADLKKTAFLEVFDDS